MNDRAVPGAGQPPRVLVLDDDPFMLEMLKDMLHSLGVRDIHLAASTRRALSTLSSLSPDLLICDLALPDVDGVEFLTTAAEGGFRGQVVLISGLDDDVRDAAGELVRTLGLRLAGCFGKPIGLAQLRSSIGC